MRTEDIDNTRPSKWIPIADRKTLAALGKLAEEVNELGTIIARSIIQGLDGADPKTGIINIDALATEIADVRGLSALLIKQLDLDESAIAERGEKKHRMKSAWIEML
jgi:hypothetical protein